MAATAFNQIDDLVVKSTLDLDQAIKYIENKYSSSNKQINKNDIKELSTIINQAKQGIATISELAKQNLIDNFANSFNNIPTMTSSKNAASSYAQVASGQEPLHQYIERKQQQNITESTIIISAKDNHSPTDVVMNVNNGIKGFRDRNLKFKINKVIKSKRGTIIKLPKEENIDQLIEEFKKIDQINNSANIYVPTPRDPTIVLKSINKLTCLTDLPIILCSMNSQLSGFENKIKVLFAMKSNSSTHDVVLRVSPIVYETVKPLKRLYTDFQVTEIRDKVLVRQCQNCYLFDHNSKNCSKPKVCNTCGKIGDHDCSLTVRCANCVNHPKFKFLSLNHKPNNKECPIYLDQINKLIQRTCYHGLDHDIVSSSRFSAANSSSNSHDL